MKYLILLILLYGCFVGPVHNASLLKEMKEIDGKVQVTKWDDDVKREKAFSRVVFTKLRPNIDGIVVGVPILNKKAREQLIDEFGFRAIAEWETIATDTFLNPNRIKSKAFCTFRFLFIPIGNLWLYSEEKTYKHLLQELKPKDASGLYGVWIKGDTTQGLAKFILGGFSCIQVTAIPIYE